MTKLVLAAGLCCAVVITASVAPAGAEEPSGTCTIHGSAYFGPHHLKTLPAEVGYEFEGTANCEFLPGREVREGFVEAHGEETLSCAGSLGEAEGEGTLTLGGVKFPFGLTFVSGAPGSTGLVVKFANGGVAVGTASFLRSTIEPAAQCFFLGGAAALEYDAVATGEL